MTLRRCEPGIDELLADAVVRAMMRADRVEPEALRSLLSVAAARLGAGNEAAGVSRPQQRGGQDETLRSARRGVLPVTG